MPKGTQPVFSRSRIPVDVTAQVPFSNTDALFALFTASCLPVPLTRCQTGQNHSLRMPFQPVQDLAPPSGRRSPQI